MILGIFLRHVKAYKGITFIPVGSKYNFVSYVGENGSGKSSILEALDAFFNNKPYLINKSALDDGVKTSGNEPFISPVFLIKKDKITRQKKEFEKVSEYFWTVTKKSLPGPMQSSMSEFFNIRDSINYDKNDYYLLVAGEYNLNNSPSLYFGSFHSDDNFISHILDEDKIDEPDRKKSQKDKFSRILSLSEWKKFLSELKSAYSYVYFPVELDVESVTKIETTEMQKIFDKQIKEEIKKSLRTVNFNNQNGINKTLESFVSEIEVILNKEYCYHTGRERNNTVTENDLVNKILEVYFHKRILNKKDAKGLTKVSELSAGEKRQALIDLVYAFLKRNSKRDTMVIIGIDEPENSLHTSLCYDQFEKLKEISVNNQILITTHWYGYLPIISQGYGHFLKHQINKETNKVSFETYDLYDYKSKVPKENKNSIPVKFSLKSTYDLVQSIFYSLKNNYNWIICEGVSEKIYFEHFFMDEIKHKKLKILPVGGQNKVIRLYKYLKEPIKEENFSGKVYCLIDTDNQIHEQIKNIQNINLVIYRLSNKTNEKTDLVGLDKLELYPTDIEMALNPLLFEKTINVLSESDEYKVKKIVNESGNSDFIKNFENLKIKEFFSLNNGDNKILFAKKYIEFCKAESDDELVPQWIKKIKEYFK